VELFVAASMSLDRDQRYSRASVAREAWRNATASPESRDAIERHGDGGAARCAVPRGALPS
jgi:hypothetical protein